MSEVSATANLGERVVLHGELSLRHGAALWRQLRRSMPTQAKQVQAEGENVEASVASLSRALQRSLEQLAGRVVQCLVSRGEQDSARASRSE